MKPSRDGSRPLPQTAVGHKVKVLVRPEKLKVLKSTPGSEQNVIDGTLKEVLYQGPVTQFFVNPKEETKEPIMVTQPNSAMTARKSFTQGEKVHVAWLPEDCLLMDKEELVEKAPALTTASRIGLEKPSHVVA